MAGALLAGAAFKIVKQALTPPPPPTIPSPEPYKDTPWTGKKAGAETAAAGLDDAQKAKNAAAAAGGAEVNPLTQDDDETVGGGKQLTGAA